MKLTKSKLKQIIREEMQSLYESSALVNKLEKLEKKIYKNKRLRIQWESMLGGLVAQGMSLDFDEWTDKSLKSIIKDAEKLLNTNEAKSKT